MPEGAGAAPGADLLPGKRLLGAQLRSVGGWEKLPCLSFWKQMNRPTAHKPILKTVHFAQCPPSGEKPVEGDSFHFMWEASSVSCWRAVTQGSRLGRGSRSRSPEEAVSGSALTAHQSAGSSSELRARGPWQWPQGRHSWRVQAGALGELSGAGPGEGGPKQLSQVRQLVSRAAPLSLQAWCQLRVSPDLLDQWAGRQAPLMAHRGALF